MLAAYLPTADTAVLTLAYDILFPKIIDIPPKKVYNFHNNNMGVSILTEYLTNYMKYISDKLEKCSDENELKDILSEHLDKIAFMQHERIVHFLVTFMFAVILCIFMCAFIFSENIMLLLLVTIIMVLLAFYIKHYYFLENTVQEMYKIYDKMLEKRKIFREV